MIMGIVCEKDVSFISVKSRDKEWSINQWNDARREMSVPRQTKATRALAEWATLDGTVYRVRRKAMDNIAISITYLP